jgi:murein biosynthesis integral membrane protein MurJ
MNLVRNFATVGGATLMSRVLGFVRDVLLAAAVGAGPVADAFVVAFRLPNLFRRLFAEGAFNSAFIPLFGRAVEEDGEESARRFAGEIGTALLFCLLALTALAQIFMPFVVWALAPGFIGDPEKFDLTVFLTRITFPYLTLVSILALISGVLNGLGRFAAAAFAPTLLNVVLIGVLWALLAVDLAGEAEAGMWLAIGVVIGGFAQLALGCWRSSSRRISVETRSAALVRADEAAGFSRGARDHCWRHHADQHRGWHHDRLAAGGCCFAALLCRSALSIAAWRCRDRYRRRAATGTVAAAEGGR